MIYDKVR